MPFPTSRSVFHFQISKLALRALVTDRPGRLPLQGLVVRRREGKCAGFCFAAAVLIYLLGRTVSGAPVESGLLQAPLYFERNSGQTDPSVDFVSRGPGYTLFMSANEAVLSLRAKKQNPHEAKRGEPVGAQADSGEANLRMSLVGARRQVRGQGLDQRAGTANYLIGNDPAQWQTAIPLFSKVKYDEVYPGIDLIFYGAQNQLEYDFVVKPFGDPKKIGFNLSGAERVEIDPKGNLIICTPAGNICWKKPFAYQDSAAGRQEVQAKFVIKHRRQIRFELGKYDTSRELTIDPKLYATYLGGSAADYALGIAVDASGNVVVIGDTRSLNFPTKLGYRSTPVGSNDVFVTKLNASGTDLIWSTYLGGSADDYAGGIALDAAGNPFLTGYTESQNFPTRNAAFSANSGFFDIFITKLTANGSNLVYSTYIGGSGDDFGRAIAIQTNGSAYVTGRTYSKGNGSGPFPTTAGVYQANNGSGNVVGADVFVTKLATNGTLSYSTFLGGSTDEKGNAIAVDNAGNAYVTGEVLANPVFPAPPSSDFPIVNAFQPSFNQGSTDPFAGTSDGFLTKLNPAGSALVFSTFLGGFDNDIATGIALDPSGRIALTGTTSSTNFPTMNAAQPVNAGVVNDPDFPGPDAFVTQFQSNGLALRYSTFLGGTIDEYPFLIDRFGIAVDNFGNLYVAGQSGSLDFPVTPGAEQTNSTAAIDAFVAKINPAVSGPASLVYATILSGNSGLAPGGADNESGPIAVDANGNFYIAGITSATNFPVTGGVFRGTNSGGFNDAFVAKFSSPRDLSITMSASADPVVIGSNVTYTVRINNNGPLTFNGVTNFVQFPANVQFGEITNSYGTPPTTNAGLLTFVLGVLTNNASVVQTITIVNVTPGLTMNTATLTSVENNFEPNLANNTAVVSSNVRGIADVTLAQSASPSPGFVGSNLVYTVGVTNKGPSPATLVMVTNALPSNVSFVNATATQGTFTNANGILIWNVGSLANGVGARLLITNLPLTAGNATNTAVVSASEFDFIPANNSSSLVTSVLPTPDADLAVSQNANPSSVIISSNVTFTIVVSNRGPSAAANAVLTDSLPNALSPISAQWNGGPCSVIDGVVTCNFGTLNSNASVTATIVARATLDGIVTNTATVSSSTLDLVSANNTASSTITINENTNTPLLRITRAGNNVVLSWATNATAAGFVLQSKTNLSASVAWANVTNAPVTIGNRSYVTNAIAPGPARNYRLRK